MIQIRFFSALKNTIKSPTLGSLIYPILFTTFLLFDFDVNIQLNYFIILLIITLSYIFTCFLFVFNGIHKKLYYLTLGLAFVIMIIPLLPKSNFLNIKYPSLVWYISSFLIFHRVFYYSYNLALPINRRTKLKQMLALTKQKTGLLIRNLQISPSNLLILNFFITVILWVLNNFDYLSISIGNDTIVQINATIYALILPLSLAIVTSNEYSKISKYYAELYQGWNLLFFLSYLIIIIASIMFPNDIVTILSLFMILNTFAFILNLTKQTSTEEIVGRLFNKLENEINKGNYSFIKSTKSSINWSAITGLKITEGIVDKNKEFEYNIDLLNQLASRAIQNNDKDTFIRIVRGYLNLSRFFLRISKSDKEKVSNLLSQIHTLSRQAVRDYEFLKILIDEINHDYRLHEIFIDIKVWNLQRLKLMISVAENNKDTEEVLNYAASVLIKMLLSKVMEGKFGPKSIYNNFSNESYVQFNNTDEYKELEKFIKNNEKNIDKIQIIRNLDLYRYENESEQKFFDESKKELLKSLKISK